MFVGGGGRDGASNVVSGFGRPRASVFFAAIKMASRRCGRISFLFCV
jgi:hypothetical protein